MVNRTNKAFTLAELLVSLAVFAMLIALLLQIFGSVASSSDLSQRRIEVLRHAMGALERVNFDLHEFVRTGGANILVIKGSPEDPNDSLYFLAPVASGTNPASPRKLSLVKYGIDESPAGQPDFGRWPSMPSLARTVRSFGWNEDVGRLLPLTDTTIASGLQGGVTQQISPCVIRYEICFQTWNGEIINSPPADSKSIRSLIIGVVAIDKKSASRLTDAERLALSARFEKPSSGQLPSERWNSVTDNFPRIIKEGIRIYEQTISI